MNDKYLTDEATRQEHLSDLLDWINVRVNVYTREVKQHGTFDDKLELTLHTNAVKLVQGYLDSFTKDIPTDIEEPKIERARLSDINTRYSHLVSLMEMWRDAAEAIRDQHVSKTVMPTAAATKIKMFRGAVSIVEIYQESLAGIFTSGVSRSYPAFKEASNRILKPILDEAGKAGVMANKKRLLDAANEKIESEEKKETSEPEKIETRSDRLHASDTGDDTPSDRDSEEDSGSDYSIT